MKLRPWIKENDGTQMKFAKRARIQQSAVSRICLGGDARGRVWACIATATDGEVTPLDHFPPTKRRGKK